MLDTLKEAKREIVSSVSREQYIEAFKWMLLARSVEEKLASLWRAGKIAGGVYLGKGQEAISAALGTLLKPGDIFGPLIRDQAETFPEIRIGKFLANIGNPSIGEINAGGLGCLFEPGLRFLPVGVSHLCNFKTVLSIKNR